VGPSWVRIASRRRYESALRKEEKTQEDSDAQAEEEEEKKSAQDPITALRSSDREWPLPHGSGRFFF
jgi:hypothetical protein